MSVINQASLRYVFSGGGGDFAFIVKTKGANLNCVRSISKSQGDKLEFI